MNRFTLVAGLALFCSVALADDIAPPKFTPGDTWVYHETKQVGANLQEGDVELVVVRPDGDDLLVSIKAVGSKVPPTERMFRSDWSQFRGINGVETIVMRPLAFPLAPGKSWKLEYTELNPNAQQAKVQFEVPFRAVDWEDVETPAGKFKALKIEAKGTWIADLNVRVRTDVAVAPNNGVVASSRQDVVQGARRAQGRLYHALWYAPEIKRWVKSLDENYNSNGEVSAREESSLIAYHMAGAISPSPAATPSSSPSPAQPTPTPSRP